MIILNAIIVSISSRTRRWILVLVSDDVRWWRIHGQRRRETKLWQDVEALVCIPTVHVCHNSSTCSSLYHGIRWAVFVYLPGREDVFSKSLCKRLVPVRASASIVSQLQMLALTLQHQDQGHRSEEWDEEEEGDDPRVGRVKFQGLLRAQYLFIFRSLVRQLRAISVMFKPILVFLERFLEMSDADDNNHDEKGEQRSQEHDKVVPVSSWNTVIRNQAMSVEVGDAPVTRAAMMRASVLHHLAGRAELAGFVSSEQVQKAICTVHTLPIWVQFNNSWVLLWRRQQWCTCEERQC